jgi:hypothetical protein
MGDKEASRLAMSAGLTVLAFLIAAGSKFLFAGVMVGIGITVAALLALLILSGLFHCIQNMEPPGVFVFGFIGLVVAFVFAACFMPSWGWVGIYMLASLCATFVQGAIYFQS